MILVTVHFNCGGCEAKEDVKAWAHRSHMAPYGGAYGSRASYQDLVPEGWVAFDPYTDCTYCPKCWAEIEAAPIVAADAGRG